MTVTKLPTREINPGGHNRKSLVSEELEQLDTAATDFGAIAGIPNHLENLQEVIDAVEQFQRAIASDNDNEHTAALESWLSGQATAEMTREGSPLNDDDLDNDLMQRAQAEVSAALDMITQMLNDFEMPADQQVQLKAMQSELQSALGSRNPGQILQAAADIRSAQGTFGGLAAATRDYAELLRERQTQLASQLHDIDRDQRENIQRLRDANLSEELNNDLDDYQEAVEAANDEDLEVGSAEWRRRQEDVRVAHDRVQDTIERERDARGGNLPPGVSDVAEDMSNNQDQRDRTVAESIENDNRLLDLENNSRPQQRTNSAGIEQQAMRDGEEHEPENTALAALREAGIGRG